MAGVALEGGWGRVAAALVALGSRLLPTREEVQYCDVPVARQLGRDGVADLAGDRDLGSAPLEVVPARWRNVDRLTWRKAASWEGWE
jgi:hypothetical protein